ncbi:MAG: hypothetical protein EA377_04465 [Phycisphaerales bacterium]|nr:MAG: hypothetical protein EA377_04465 [Phycisphaerales bacterium]
MQIWLDTEPCDLQADSVGTAIAACASLAEERGRMIVEIEVDGESWGQQQLEQPECLGRVAGEVRLTSAEPRDLVQQTFTDAVAALEEAETMQTRAAEKIQADQQAEAMEEIREVCGIWLAVQQAVQQGTELIDVDLNELKVNDTTAPAIIEQLRKQLMIIREQLEAQDHLALADTLLYDCPAVIQNWRDMLDSLQRGLDR